MSEFTHTHEVMEKIVKESQSPAASYERTGCEDCLKDVKQSQNIKKTVQSKNPIIHEKINHVSKQKGELDPEPARLTSWLLCQLRYKAQILKTVQNTKPGSDNDPTGKDQQDQPDQPVRQPRRDS